MADESKPGGGSTPSPEELRVEAEAPAAEHKDDESAGTGFIGQDWREQAGKFAQQAGDRARTLADESKTRASDALAEFSKMMGEAAGTVDEKLGADYGKYARSAADSLAGFADTLKGKEVDELLDDARELVRKSPAVAIGTAAALGFVLARLIKSGVDAASDLAENAGRKRGGDAEPDA